MHTYKYLSRGYTTTTLIFKTYVLVGVSIFLLQHRYFYFIINVIFIWQISCLEETQVSFWRKTGAIQRVIYKFNKIKIEIFCSNFWTLNANIFEKYAHEAGTCRLQFLTLSVKLYCIKPCLKHLKRSWLIITFPNGKGIGSLFKKSFPQKKKKKK